MNAYVEVIYSEGTSELFAIEHDQATVGRSPGASVPLPDVRELEPEHVLLVPRAEGCWVAPARDAAVPVLLHGQRIEPCMVPWGTELELGGLRLKLHPTRPDVSGKPLISTPVKLVAAVVVIGVLAFNLMPKGMELPTAVSMPQPPLLDEKEPPTCPARGEVAERRAQTAADAAFAKYERYDFEPQDGIQAIDLYALADACFSVAGNRSEANRVRNEKQAVIRKIEEDYKTHHFRLERALQVGDVRSALYESRVLYNLAGHQSNPEYRERLQSTARDLELMLEEYEKEQAEEAKKL